jgi:hypothetical protein
MKEGQPEIPLAGCGVQSWEVEGMELRSKRSLTLLAAAVLCVLALVLALSGCGRVVAVSGHVVPAIGGDWALSDPTTVATMYLGSDLYGVGVPCSVAVPLDLADTRAVKILDVDGRPTDQVFRVEGVWRYADALHTSEYPYCSCANGWCDGCALNGAATTVLTGALVVPPGSVDPPNPTNTPRVVHVVLKGTLQD